MKSLSQLTERDELIDNAMKSSRRFAAAPHGSVDGGALKESKRIPQQNGWIAEGTRFLTGRDFVLTCKLRINAMPTKSHTSRGRIQNKSCRAGRNMPETLNHVLQICHRTHDARIRRHDAVVARGLEQRNHRVTRGTEFHTEEGVRKPDLIATKMGRSIVIDAQVVSEHETILDLAHKRKSEYYSKNASLRRVIAKYGTEEVQFSSATLSWRGLWSARSAKDVIKSGVISKSDLKVISSRVLVEGVAAWTLFNRRTSTKKSRVSTRQMERTGVG